MILDNFSVLWLAALDPQRDHVFAEKNWHDYEDHVRMARDKRFKLIHNAYWDLPQTPSADSARSPTYQSLVRAVAFELFFGDFQPPWAI